MAHPPEYPYRLFAPGPVPLSEGVRQALAEPMIHHRSEAFKKILRESLNLLQHVFQTRQPVMILNSVGSGAMEAALVNTLSPGDEALFIVAGKFGERWWKMGQAFGLKCFALEVPWGEAVSPETLTATLKKRPTIKAVFCQACETSTAVAQPLREIAKVIRQHAHESLFVVDAMTALGAMPIEMDEWGIDVLVAGSQKAFMLPAGISFIALSDRAWKMATKSTMPKYYFDLAAELESNTKNETRFSSSVSHIRALHTALQESFAGPKLARTIARSQVLARATREVCTQVYQLQIYPKAPSSSVSALLIPEAIQDKNLTKILLNKFNLFIGGGQDQLKGKIFRVGHLGHISDEDQLFFVQALGLALKECGWAAATDHSITQAVALTRQLLTSKE